MAGLKIVPLGHCPKTIAKVYKKLLGVFFCSIEGYPETPLSNGGIIIVRGTYDRRVHMCLEVAPHPHTCRAQYA